MSEIKITKENFQKEVLESDKTVLLDFFADWCGPCQMLSPIINEIAQENPQIKVGKINVDEQQELAMQYNVMSIPFLAVFKNGKLDLNTAHVVFPVDFFRKETVQWLHDNYYYVENSILTESQRQKVKDGIAF